jgi:hypothetical protein
MHYSLQGARGPVYRGANPSYDDEEDQVVAECAMFCVAESAMVCVAESAMYVEEDE